MTVMQDDHWQEAQKMLIKEAFALFDKDKKGWQHVSFRLIFFTIRP